MSRLPASFKTLAAGALLLLTVPCWAERIEERPPELEGVGITEKLGQPLPLQTPFTTSEGQAVKLGDFFDGRRPVILTLNYSNCPMLCSLQLNGLFEGLRGLSWDIGERFQMVTVSIDPLETPARAAQTKEKYLKIYNRPNAADGWRLLTGGEADIRSVADAVGFGYKWEPKSKQFLHAAGIFVCTPDGKVSRCLYGVEYPPQSLKLALLEASEGKIGTTVDQILLYCFHYDADARRYAPVAFRIMQLGGAVAVVVVGAGLGLFWRRERRKARTPPAP